MRNIFSRLSIKNEFAKNALMLTIGTSIAQFFPMLFYPVLCRIFTPAEFGLLEILTTITTILAVIATGKYESSILVTRTKKEAANIVGLVLSLSSSLLFTSFIVLQIFSYQLSEWLHTPELKNWLFVCPLSAFAIIIYNCYNEWCVRNKYFINLSWNKITNAAATTLSKLLLGLVKIVNNGLIGGDLIGRYISAGTCIFRTLKKDRIEFSKVSYKHMRVMARKYIEFPKFTLPDQLLSTIGGSIPVLFIGAYFNNSEVGFFAMTMNILSVPISVISIAVKDVFRQRANEEYIKNGNCTVIYLQLLKFIIKLGVSGSLLLFFFLPSIFSLVLGKQWQIAGEYSQILLPMVLLSFISMSLSGVLIITGKMKVSMYWQIYYVLITILSLFIGLFFFKNIKITLVCFAVGRSSAYLIYIMLSYKYSKGEIFHATK